MCTNTDPDIDLPHCKCVWCRWQNIPTFYFTDGETSPSLFMPYINNNFYKNINRYIIHVSCPLSENKKCSQCESSDNQASNAKISTQKYIILMND